MMAAVTTPRRRRVLRHTRDYIARLGSRREALARIREADTPQVEERLRYVGRLDVDFLASNASLLTMHSPAGEFDVGERLARLVGAEREGGAWPDMQLEVRLTVEVLRAPPSVADLFLDG